MTRSPVAGYTLRVRYHQIYYCLAAFQSRTPRVWSHHWPVPISWFIPQAFWSSMTIIRRTKFIANDTGLLVTPTPSSGILLALQGLTFIDRPYKQFIIGVLLHRSRGWNPWLLCRHVLKCLHLDFHLYSVAICPRCRPFGANAELVWPSSLTVYKFPKRPCLSTNIYFLCFSMTTASNDILSWTNQDPRESQLFNSWGVLYRFQVRGHAQSFQYSINTCFLDVRYSKWPEHYNIVASYPPEQGRSCRTARMGVKWRSRSRHHWKG